MPRVLIPDSELSSEALSMVQSIGVKVALMGMDLRGSITVVCKMIETRVRACVPRSPKAVPEQFESIIPPPIPITIVRKLLDNVVNRIVVRFESNVEVLATHRQSLRGTKVEICECLGYCGDTITLVCGQICLRMARCTRRRCNLNMGWPYKSSHNDGARTIC